MLTRKLQDYCEERRRQGLYRQRQVSDVSDGMVSFCSNDYLSFSQDAGVKKAYQDGAKRYATGSGGSMLICGYHAIHRTLERAFAEALGVQDCLLFSSGYAANISLIRLLATFQVPLLIDKAVHASIYDGLESTALSYRRFLHNDPRDLALKWQTSVPGTMVMTEGIFSMSGQMAPLSTMASLPGLASDALLVDEAHAFGVMGNEGLGAVVQHGLTEKEVPLRVIPLGKACAALGAVVAGQGIWIDALMQLARPYIYSTALSPAAAYGVLETLSMVRAADDRRAKLFSLIAYFRQSISHSSLVWRDSLSPIQQLQLGCPARALHYATVLRQQGLLCFPMRQPTVSLQETGLRILLNHHHEPEDIDALLSCLEAI